MKGSSSLSTAIFSSLMSEFQKPGPQSEEESLVNWISSSDWESAGVDMLGDLSRGKVSRVNRRVVSGSVVDVES